MHVAARLARSSRLGISTDVPSKFLVVRGDPGKLDIIKKYPDIHNTRSAFTDLNGLELILTDEILVRFADFVNNAERREMIKKHNCVVLNDTKNIWRIGVLDRDDDAPLNVANTLSEAKGVEFAEPNALQPARFEVLAPSDGRFTDQWHLHNTGQGGGTPGADVNALDAWDRGYGDSSIRVVVHDTGVDITHPDLTANVGTGWDFDNNDNNATHDTEAHGTACAGIIASSRDGQGTVGIAPGCTIIPLRAAGAHTWETWADTIRWAANHGDIISCSWTISQNNTLSSAIREVVRTGRSGRGTPVFFATGNGYASSIGFPASLEETIAVGASTNKDKRSDYSNYGEGIDFVAPSSGGTRRIETTDIQNDEGYNTNAGTAGNYCEAEAANGFGGTSAATPLAAGVAALMLSVNPDLSANDVRNILQDTAIKIASSDANYSVNDGTVGRRVESLKWTSGWTTANIYTIGSKTYLFLLKKSGTGADGKNVHIHKMNSDGTVGARVQSLKWTSGWTTAEFYKIGAKTYLFLLKKTGTGADGNNVHIHQMMEGWSEKYGYGRIDAAAAVNKAANKVCVIAQTAIGTELAQELGGMRAFRDAILMKSATGRNYLAMLDANKLELITLLKDAEVKKEARDLLRKINRIVKTRDQKKPLTFSKGVIGEIRASLEKIEPKTKRQLKKSIVALKKDLTQIEGSTITKGLKMLDRKKLDRVQIRKVQRKIKTN